MKKINSQLDRLLRSASLAHHPLPLHPPFALESRVLNAWRLGAQDADAALLWSIAFRRVLIAACILMLLSIFLSLPGASLEPSNELTIADNLIKLSLLP